MNKEFDKTKVYTSLNITKDLIGAKGYYDDDIKGLRDSLNNGDFKIPKCLIVDMKVIVD